nr:gephyrin-like molybdotransferase Glp [uncultured Flavobacterium sp.]
METMISVQRAFNLIAQEVSPMASVEIPIELANGLVVAETIYSPENVPAFSQSSMDGYAFAYDENIVSYQLVGEMAAGSSTPFHLNPGEAVRIFTGAAVPFNADTVLMQEKALVQAGKLKILDDQLKKGNNVRQIGSEIAKGDKAVEKGTALKPAVIGFLASMGISKVKVYPNPKVAVVVTGNELVSPGGNLEYGQLFESNSFTLTAALKQMGIQDVTVVQVKDDLDQLHTVLSQIIEAHDLVLISGGVSVGDYDFTLKALELSEVKTIFHKVKQKPGKPLLFAVKSDTVIFGLPGNPASVLTCFYEYVLPAISKMTLRKLALQFQKAILQNYYSKPEGMTHFLKAKYQDNLVSLGTGQESYKLSSFAEANCLAIFPAEVSKITSGETIEVHLFA